ncbi:hypothetical protein [Streptomyces sp. VRA16 Mangrove soil]|uniref:hypothetical protein n=1 Tax=Streptomyces sp. VRA16 Mangrove soil TaxID=2817434 RepID=UPI001A9E5F54|nr:hypothetical protein [Streptomyces sp. VRA16 Mangrove soil]MBO1330273.1 hypothetical protein [Streptomyces sp. VRA16 Mangrove soil]
MSSDGRARRSGGWAPGRAARDDHASEACLAQVALDLPARRAPGASICPSDAARRAYEGESVEADSDLASKSDLLGLAKDLKGAGPDRTHLLTPPVAYDTQGAGRVVPMDRDGRKAWSAPRHDRPGPRSATHPSVGDTSRSPVSAGS